MKKLSYFLLLFVSCQSINVNNLPKLDEQFGEASAVTKKDALIVSTGKVERTWNLTESGLLTKALKDLTSGEEYKNNSEEINVDWAYYGLIDDNSKAQLISLEANQSSDEGFTSEHIEVVAEFLYPETETSVRYVIWAYPGAPGIRTQLYIKGDSNKITSEISEEKETATGRVDYIPVNSEGAEYTCIGYNNDTQHRNKPETPIMQEEIIEKPDNVIMNINWANIIRVDKSGNGVMVVKESHKCVNQYGVDTGEFLFTKDGVQNTGTSVLPSDLSKEEYQWCWATWSILYAGAQDGAELALKQFDRFRYPVVPELDIYTQANTWGSGRNRDASQEENILIELETQKELGIDIQQIDDGWQTKDWKLRQDWYPNGWENVVSKSKETGVKLGLWAAAMPIKYEDLKQHYDEAGFVTYKLDFANLGSHQNITELIEKIRKFILYTDHSVRVNWDVTENAPRYGYYWAREYGCVYLENRKPMDPLNVIYVPHLVLRDVWQVAKYTNINKFQTSIQNIDMVSKKFSDAHLHNHPYAVAIGLIGTPLFFQETHNYNSEAKEQIKNLLATYKKYRDEMYDSYVFPIGNIPNNKNWTGFQWYSPKSNDGYLLIFRELNNSSKEEQLGLRFLENRNVKITNLQNEKSYVESINEGKLKVSIEKPADFVFLKYELMD